jgi:tripartite ATP-independent transporter DctP family solute receptor
MKKKFFVLIAVAVFCVFFAAQLSWAAKYTIRFSHTMSAKPDAQYHIWALKFKELAEEFSKGELEVKVFPGGQFGGQIAAGKKLQMGGIIEMMVGASNNLAALCSALDIFTLPYIFKDVPCGVVRVLHNRALREDISQETERRANFRIPAWTTAGMRNMMNSKHPILKPADLHDLRMRVAKNPILVDAYKAWGGNPISIANTETFSALQTGVADGNDGTASWAWNLKFYEVQKYYSITNHQMTPVVMIINSKFYRGLPENIRRAIDRAAVTSTVGYIDCWIINQHRSIVKGFEEKGMEMAYPDLEPFREGVRPVWDKYSDHVGGWDRINRVLDLQKDW